MDQVDACARRVNAKRCCRRSEVLRGNQKARSTRQHRLNATIGSLPQDVANYLLNSVGSEGLKGAGGE